MRVAGLLVVVSVVWTCGALAADQPQWGQKLSRNMVSSETGLVDTFDPETGTNVKWVAQLGSETHSTPIVAGGRVFIAVGQLHHVLAGGSIRQTHHLEVLILGTVLGPGIGGS